jgi:hypothetical protein
MPEEGVPKMADEPSYVSIADASKPNPGRIYDFVLGGNHNFEVDRQAAQEVLKQIPFFPKLARLMRWFLGEAVRRLAADGYMQFMDFASGLPTNDHIHQITPAGTKVIYSDIDAVTVAYGQEILKDNRDARYVKCNAGKPENLLGATVTSQLFGNNRRIVIGFNGIAFFLSNDDVGHAMKVLYDWTAPGSRLFLCDACFEGASVSPTLQETFNIYEKLGQPMTFRSLDTLKQLIQPWKVREPGFLPLEEWIGMKAVVAEETQKADEVIVRGAILER